MTLKIGDKTDRYKILKLVQKLYESSIYSKETFFSKEDTLESIDKLLEGDQKDGVVIIAEDNKKPVGVLAASYMLHMFNRKEKTAVELAFWLEPEFRSFKNLRTLVGAYKYWAKKIGCTSIMMGKLKSDKTTETYTIRRL